MGRRSNGEGHFGKWHKGKEVYWRGIVTDETGKQHPVCRKSRTEALAEFNALKESIRNGNCIASANESVGKWLLFWFQNYYVPNTRESTAATAESNIRLHLIPALGKVPLQKLTCDHIQRFISAEQKKGTSPATIRRYLTILRSAVKHALIARRINYDPFLGVKTPKSEKPEIRSLDKDEQEKMLAHLPATTNGRAIKFLLVTGLRVSELIGLQWQDIQSDGIHIQRNIQRVKKVGEDEYEDFVNPPKTHAGKRVLPSTDEIDALLFAQRRAQIQERIKACAAWEGGQPGAGETYVFATATGKRTDRSNLTRTYKKALQEAGLPKLGIHTLRHSFATNCIQNEGKISDTANLLGHSDPAFTLRTYVHPDREGMEETMRRNSEIIRCE